MWFSPRHLFSLALLIILIPALVVYIVGYVFIQKKLMQETYTDSSWPDVGWNSPSHRDRPDTPSEVIGRMEKGLEELQMIKRMLISETEQQLVDQTATGVRETKQKLVENARKDIQEEAHAIMQEQAQQELKNIEELKKQLQPKARGGQVYPFRNYRVHKFTQSGDFKVDRNVTVDVLVVGGGGAGGDQSGFGTAGGGGGGAGGVVYEENLTFQRGENVRIVVGKGAPKPGRNDHGQKGQDSLMGSLRAYGGGGGGTRDHVPTSGGSGGGARREYGWSREGGDALQNPPGMGNPGGDASRNGGGNSQGGGGGGGAGSRGRHTGEDGKNARYDGGNGGRGVDFSLEFGTDVGDNGWFASGGGGGTGMSNGSLGSASKGGGGIGAKRAGDPAQNGMNGTGGGGGGGASKGATAGAGGDGIVLIRYRT